MKKHEVVQLIVEMSNDNEQMTKSMFGETLVEAAKKALNSTPDINNLKAIAESIIFLTKCIEDLQNEVADMKNTNQGMYVYSESDIKGLERLIRKYYENLNRVISQI